ncbi:MAG: pentapeptide repeat-containing protein [Desulfocapsaceae bacterium]|nr:pentapeptide repeat-containing protein [Desulfocapsaceae bacterium]
MANPNALKLFLEGSSRWNSAREEVREYDIDLSDTDFHSEITAVTKDLFSAEIDGYDLSDCNLNRVSLRNCYCIRTSFARSHLHFSDLVDGYFQNCSFVDAELQVSKIGSAKFSNCDFTGAKLSYCSAEETDFTGSTLRDAAMDNMSLVATDFTGATLERCSVYGISAWDLVLDGANQSDLYIAKEFSGISVPSIELAQFVSLLVNNPSIRNVIETITSKAVLILGRFTKNRKATLDELRRQLTARGYVPILFDFEVPSTRDITETIITLASLSKFVVADLSEPKSVPQELSHIVPHFPSIPLQPIILNTEREYGMFEHFKSYPWVLEVLQYQEGNVSILVDEIISKCEAFNEPA